MENFTVTLLLVMFLSALVMFLSAVLLRFIFDFLFYEAVFISILLRLVLLLFRKCVAFIIDLLINVPCVDYFACPIEEAYIHILSVLIILYN